MALQGRLTWVIIRGIALLETVGVVCSAQLISALLIRNGFNWKYYCSRREHHQVDRPNHVQVRLEESRLRLLGHRW